jgi:hypothetical protein
MLHGCMGTLFGKEGGIQVLAGLVPSSQKVGSLLKKTLAGKAGQKILAKKSCGKFTSIEKCTWLLLTQ